MEEGKPFPHAEIAPWSNWAYNGQKMTSRLTQKSPQNGPQTYMENVKLLGRNRRKSLGSSTRQIVLRLDIKSAMC